MKRIPITILLGTLLTFAWSSCITRKYKNPDYATEKLFRDTLISDSSTLASLHWDQLFTDTILQQLIREGLGNNLDLKIAMQRMAETHAAYKQSKAAFLPSLTAGIGVTRAKASQAALNLPAGLGINLGTTVYQASLASSWEADIWGKLSSSKKSAFARLLESEAAKNAVQTQLIASIASGYYSLLALDKQLLITEQTVKSRTEEAAIMKDLKESAIVNGAAVVQSEANRYSAEVSLPDLRQRIRETENQLSILLARPAGAIKRSLLDRQEILSNLQTGLPIQLLQNRPDVRQAEYAFRASFENTNIARSYFYPALTITAQGGLSTLKLTDFFNGSAFYNFVGGLTQPLFSQGTNKARLKSAAALQEQQRYRYQATLLQAGEEVSNYLYAYRAAKEKENIRSKQLVALEQSVTFTKDLLRYSSSTNYTDVLTSEQSLLAAQLSSVNDRLQQLQSVVGLYQALGGGWQ